MMCTGATIFTVTVAVILVRRTIMGAVQDAVDAITAQLEKAKTEIVTAISDLEAQVAAGETPDLTALRAAAQGLDDVVPDTIPTEEPSTGEPTEGESTEV